MASALSWSPDEQRERLEAEDADIEESTVVTPALVRIAVVAGLGGRSVHSLALTSSADTSYRRTLVVSAISPHVKARPATHKIAYSGYDTGVVSGALLVIHSDLGGSPLTTFQEEMLVSSALLGALGGSLLAGKSADRFGRKPVILMAAVLFTLGGELSSPCGARACANALLEQLWSKQLHKCTKRSSSVSRRCFTAAESTGLTLELPAGRVLVGLAVGLASSVLPIFLAEVSPAKYRGRIVASLVVLITGGQVLAYIVDAAFYTVPKGWRFMFGSGAIPSIIQLCLGFSLPESPRWLIQHGRIAPARATLKAVYPLSDSAAIQRRIDRIELEVQSEEREGLLGLGAGLSLGKAKEGLVAKLWRDRANRRAVILACGLQFFQQSTGFNLLMYL